jgi:membrane-bound lytic murein transglycosylase D
MLSLDDAARFSGTDLATIRNLNPSLLRATLPPDKEPYELRIPYGTYDDFVANFQANPPKGGQGPGEYIVKSGDTLDKIARSYKLTVDELRRLNGLTGTKLNVKQKLVLPGVGSSKDVRIASTERVAVTYGPREFKPIKLGEEFQLVRQSGSTTEEPLMAVSLNHSEPDEGPLDLVSTIYKVRPGDSLGSIAKRFGISVDSLRKNNKLNGNKLTPGQELTVHATASVSDSVVAEAEAATAKKVRTYQVQDGDNLYQISRRFGVTVENLKRWNRLTDNRIWVGMNLQLN